MDNLKLYLYMCWILPAALLLQSCAGDQATAGMAPATITTLPERNILQGPANEANVLRCMYGNYNKKKSSAVWVCKDTAILYKLLDARCDTMHSRLLLMDTVWQNNVEQIWALTATNTISGNDCHPCGPVLELALFKQSGGPEWRLMNRKNIGTWGAWGSADGLRPEIKKIGVNYYGLLLHPGFTNQGYTTEGLAVFSYFRNDFRKMIELSEVTADNAGRCGAATGEACWNYDACIEYKTTEAQRFYDLIITQSGTRGNDTVNSIVPMHRKMHYAFNGREFVLVD